MAMGKKTAAVEYDTVLENGVYKPVKRGGKVASSPPEEKAVANNDLIKLGSLDNRFVKAEFAIHKDTVLPIALGSVLIGLAAALYSELVKQGK